MENNTYLEIFKHSFHFFTLKKVKKLGKFKSGDGRAYYKFIGKFEFVPTRQAFNEPFDSDNFLKWLKSLDVNESNCFSRRFTRKVKQDDAEKTTSFIFVFDIVPKNIVDAEIDASTKTMRLWVLGYGQF